MSKKSSPAQPAKALPPIPPPPQDFRCSVVGDAFQIGGKFCQFLRATDSKNALIDTATLIRRGKVKGINASMDSEAAQLFQHNLKQIPKEFQDAHRIIFPKDAHKDTRIKLLKYEDGQWFSYRVPAQGEWNSCDLLARIVDTKFELLINTEAITRNV